MIEAPSAADLTRAQRRTLAELDIAMAAHERRAEQRGAGRWVAELPIASFAREGRDEHTATAVRRLTAGGSVYGVAPEVTSARDEDIVECPLPVAVVDSLGAENSIVVFAHPPIVRSGDRYLRILGFYVHGAHRRARTPCAIDAPRADLGLTFVCKPLGAATDGSDCELFRVVVARTFAQFTIEQAARDSADQFGSEMPFLVDLLRSAVAVFLVGDRARRRREPLPRRRRTPR